MSFHVLRITAHTNLGGGNSAVNTWHFSADGPALFPVSDESKSDAANECISALKDYYDDMAIAGLAFTWTIGDSVVELNDGDDPHFITATPQFSTPVFGSVTALQIAGVTSWRTEYAGKQNRGRTYFGPLRTEATAYPDLSTTFAAQATAAANAYLAAMIPNVLVPCVLSRVGGGHTHQIVSGNSSTHARTMRTRAS